MARKVWDHGISTRLGNGGEPFLPLCHGRMLRTVKNSEKLPELCKHSHLNGCQKEMFKSKKLKTVYHTYKTTLDLFKE
ncbi:hypothetical protein POVWA1_001020 [Plasmodium ovale wallikeri]|uniref:Uncharacterized protein n=1 Tax=Plasmodium ovale wallikeri TaxID=864142 RepID=A0A1A8YFY2_PLAOA|nr:hypothetical protein POVWA1_001020 [Plasmodium ovale wallikeri]